MCLNIISNTIVCMMVFQSVWSIYGKIFMLGAICLKIKSNGIFLEWREKGANISVLLCALSHLIFTKILWDKSHYPYFINELHFKNLVAKPLSHSLEMLGQTFRFSICWLQRKTSVVSSILWSLKSLFVSCVYVCGFWTCFIVSGQNFKSEPWNAYG